MLGYLIPVGFVVGIILMGLIIGFIQDKVDK